MGAFATGRRVEKSTDAARNSYGRTAAYRRSFVLAATAGILTLTLAPTPSGAATCKAPESIVHLGKPLPRLSLAIKASQAIRIVALGSSSTSGSGASSPDKTYPARLQQRLRQHFPGRRFQVLNKGKAGQLASHMLKRLERDVLSAKPHLVLWQTGVNDAIRGVDPKIFRKNVEDGLRLMKDQGIDVVLVDQQFYPGSSKVSAYDDYLKLLHEIGEQYSVPVFRRYQLMSYLVSSSQYKLQALLAPDKFHQNDVSYDCLGQVLGDALQISLIQ